MAEKFSVPMACKTKARPRVTKNGTFMPKEYMKWKKEFAQYLKDNYETYVCDDPLMGMNIAVFFKNSARGDVDNYAGAVMDACQGTLFENDKQIKRLHIRLCEQANFDQVDFTLGPKEEF